MAQTLGQSGRYATNEVVRKRRQIFTIVVVVIAICGAVQGVIIASYLPHLPFNSWLRAVLFVLLLILLVSLFKWANFKITELEQQQTNYDRGAQGENAVAKELSRFPDSFHVLHDLKTDSGNLDHVVIGPTGVFVMDAKNWRGTVAAGPNEELLLNAKPTDKPYLKQFVGRMMNIKEKIESLTGSHDIYFQALFVFTAARVEANWGKTGSVHCLREDQLYKYIVEKDFGARIKPETIRAIARAFAQLANMEVDFTKQAKVVGERGAPY